VPGILRVFLIETDRTLVDSHRALLSLCLPRFFSVSYAHRFCHSMSFFQDLRTTNQAAAERSAQIAIKS
jgi:hypothetical protein